MLWLAGQQNDPQDDETAYKVCRQRYLLRDPCKTHSIGVFWRRTVACESDTVAPVALNQANLSDPCSYQSALSTRHASPVPARPVKSPVAVVDLLSHAEDQASGTGGLNLVFLSEDQDKGVQV